MRLSVVLSIALVAVSLGVRLGADRQPDVTLDGILARAGAYVADFEARFSSVVAEERYLQLMPGRLTRDVKGLPQPASRRLVSDFLMVKLPSRSTWLPFRDVYEVDGRPVRDRQDRLTKLFLKPAATALQQAEQIVADSARYNLGVTRNINIPIVALLIVLDPHYQARFEFSHLREDNRTGANVWIADYVEQRRPTVIRSAAGADVFTKGRVWIESDTGRVVKTELVIEERTVSATITTTYEFDAGFNLDVPVEMDEEYKIPPAGANALGPTATSIIGKATYSNFRRFNVEVEEAVRKDRE